MHSANPLAYVKLKSTYKDYSDELFSVSICVKEYCFVTGNLSYFWPADTWCRLNRIPGTPFEYLGSMHQM